MREWIFCPPKSQATRVDEQVKKSANRDQHNSKRLPLELSNSPDQSKSALHHETKTKNQDLEKVRSQSHARTNPQTDSRQDPQDSKQDAPANTQKTESQRKTAATKTHLESKGEIARTADLKAPTPRSYQPQRHGACTFQNLGLGLRNGPRYDLTAKNH